MGQKVLNEEIASTDSVDRARLVVREELISGGWTFVGEGTPTQLVARKTAYRNRWDGAFYAGFSLVQMLFAGPNAAKVPVHAVKQRDKISTTVTCTLSPSASGAGSIIILAFELSGDPVVGNFPAKDYYVIAGLLRAIRARLLGVS